jgi:hypothetical protein
MKKLIILGVSEFGVLIGYQICKIFENFFIIFVILYIKINKIHLYSCYSIGRAKKVMAKYAKIRCISGLFNFKNNNFWKLARNTAYILDYFAVIFCCCNKVVNK